MNYLKISNKGILDVEALTLLGASTKRDDDTKIGMFGSGNKYAIAYFLRNGYDLKIYAGANEIKLSTIEREFRNNKFNVILVNGRETSITTEFGKDWNLSQAIREVYCNSKDEGNHSMEIVDSLSPEEGVTSFYIENKQEITDYMGNFNTYFSERKDVLFQCGYGKILKKSEQDGKLNLYRKGISCMESNKKSLYDYDLNNVLIDENRMVMFSWDIPSKIWNLIYHCTDKEVIRNILFNCSDPEYIECISSDFADVNKSLMSQEFKEVLSELEIAPRSMARLITDEEKADTVTLPDTIYNHAASISSEIKSKFKMSKNSFYREIEPTQEQNQLIYEATQFFLDNNYRDVANYPIVVAKFDKKDFMGFGDVPNQRMVLSEDCINAGLDSIIHTILEEFIHLKYDVKDETREFQNAVIKEMINLIKR